MQAYSGPAVEFDLDAFHPQRVLPVRHQLMGHPLLQLESLVELGKRLSTTGSVRYHNADAAPDTSFANAPQSHPVTGTVPEIIARIRDARAWMALHNVQNDPVYRGLVDEILDHVRPRVEQKDPGMWGRAGWIFITSPGAVTPFHMDHENNFILQVKGEKELHVWEPLERSVISERALELFHTIHSRELVTWKDTHEQKAHVFHLQPGMGAYMPQTAPHWVKNGDGVSITISVTYYSDGTKARKMLHRGNYLLRRLGLEPSPVGESNMRDAMKLAVLRGGYAARDLMLRASGKPPSYTRSQYA